MDWEIVDTGSASAQENMRIDAQLLDALAMRTKPILHFYEWKSPSATYGYFTDPAKHLDLEKTRSLGIELAQRSTGGGIIFHLWDFAFSVLVPATHSAFSINTLENYAFVNQAVLRALQNFLGKSLELIPTDGVAYDESCQQFCMAKPTKYDVMLGARKAAGAAQRRTKQGFLHQGSIALQMPDKAILDKVLKGETRVAEAMQAYTFALLEGGMQEAEVQRAKKSLKELLQRELERV